MGLTWADGRCSGVHPQVKAAAPTVLWVVLAFLAGLAPAVAGPSGAVARAARSGRGRSSVPAATRRRVGSSSDGMTEAGLNGARLAPKHPVAAYSERQVTQHLAASAGRFLASSKGALPRRRPPAQSRRAQPTAGIGYVVGQHHAGLLEVQEITCTEPLLWAICGCLASISHAAPIWRFCAPICPKATP